MKTALFESDNRKMVIRPYTIDGTNDLAYIKITVYGGKDMNVNVNNIPELIELLQEVKSVYIDKEQPVIPR